MDKQILSYLENSSKILKNNLLTMLLATLLYIIWYLFEIHNYILSIPNIKISIGHIAYIGLLFIPAFLVINNHWLQKLWIFFSTLALLDLINLIYITNGQLNKVPYNFFSSVFIISLIILFFISILLGLSTASKKVTFKDILIVAISSIFFVFVYHLSNIWLVSQGIINRDRSLFINNLEIHHINYGVILLIFVPFLFKYFLNKSKKVKFIGLIFIGYIYGTVFDESFYYMNEFKNEQQFDKLYLNDIPVMIISVLIMIISFSIWIYAIKKQRVNNA